MLPLFLSSGRDIKLKERSWKLQVFAIARWTAYCGHKYNVRSRVGVTWFVTMTTEGDNGAFQNSWDLGWRKVADVYVMFTSSKLRFLWSQCVRVNWDDAESLRSQTVTGVSTYRSFRDFRLSWINFQPTIQKVHVKNWIDKKKKSSEAFNILSARSFRDLVEQSWALKEE